MRDGMNSANRYFWRLKEFHRQLAIDVLLGNEEQSPEIELIRQTSLVDNLAILKVRLWIHFTSLILKSKSVRMLQTIPNFFNLQDTFDFKSLMYQGVNKFFDLNLLVMKCLLSFFSFYYDIVCL